MTAEEERAAVEQARLEALAEQARVPYADAPDALEVLHDALVEAGKIPPEIDVFFHEWEEAKERAAERCRMLSRRTAYYWAATYDFVDEEAARALGARYKNISYERSCERAAEKGLEVKHPQADELFLDIDTHLQYETFKRNVQVLIRFGFVDVNGYVTTPSQSGVPERRHVVVKLTRPLSNLERIALQAALGSDPMREMLGLMRIYENNPHPTLFFERPSGSAAPAGSIIFGSIFTMQPRAGSEDPF